MILENLEPMAAQDVKLWVVFQALEPLLITSLLHPRLNHCYVVGNTGHNWWLVNPRMNYMDVVVLPADKYPPDYDLIKAIRGDRCTTVIIPAKINRRIAGINIGWYSCLSAAKRLLGIYNPFIVTPYQLYKRLRRELMEETYGRYHYEHELGQVISEFPARFNARP